MKLLAAGGSGASQIPYFVTSKKPIQKISDAIEQPVDLVYLPVAEDQIMNP
jgi:hypothetical protein